MAQDIPREEGDAVTTATDACSIGEGEPREAGWHHRRGESMAGAICSRADEQDKDMTTYTLSGHVLCPTFYLMKSSSEVGAKRALILHAF